MARPDGKPRFFRRRLLGGERLVGAFLKTPHHQIVEVLARADLDFIVLDAEHAPFDRSQLDICLMTARLSGLPALVRLNSSEPGAVLSALDMGAVGVMAPHIASADAARALVQSAKYAGTRGFSASHRAAGYGRADVARYIAEADDETLVIAQIEDRRALDALDDTLAVDGVDCVFVGRADLMASFGADSLDDRRVADAVDRIFKAAAQAGRRTGVYLNSPEGVEAFAAAGANFFIVGSDQSILKNGAKALSQSAKLEG